MPVYRAVGSGLTIIDPLESLVKNVYAIVDAVEKNYPMQALTAQAKATWKNRSGHFLERIPPSQLATRFNLKQLDRDILSALDRAMRDAGLDPTIIPDSFADIFLDKGVTVFTPSRRGQEDEEILTVVVDGEFEHWQVNDPELYRASTMMAPAADWHWMFHWLVEKPARLVRGTAVLTVGFIFRNPIIDTLTAWFQSEYRLYPRD